MNEAYNCTETFGGELGSRGTMEGGCGKGYSPQKKQISIQK